MKSNGQYSLGFEAHAAKQVRERALADARIAWDAELEWLRRAVAEVGAKEFVDAVDTNRSTVTEALKGEADRPWRAEWTAVLLQLVSDGLREEYARMKCAALGFVASRPKKMTPAEENDAMRRYFARRAPDALDAFEREVIR